MGCSSCWCLVLLRGLSLPSVGPTEPGSSGQPAPLFFPTTLSHGLGSLLPCCGDRALVAFGELDVPTPEHLGDA